MSLRTSSVWSAAGVGDHRGGHLGGGGEASWRSPLGAGKIHLGVLELVDQGIHLRAVGAQRTRLEDLPLVLAVLAELDGRPFGLQLDARELIGIEGEQALVAQVVGGLVEAGLDEARHGEYARVAGELGVGAGTGGRVVADQQLVALAVLLYDGDIERRQLQAVRLEIGGLVLDDLVGVQRGKR